MLNWSCVKGTEEKKQNVIPDQIALPSSKREIEKLPHADEIYNLNETSSKRVTVHYENSNGFMPIVVLDHRRENIITKSKDTNQKKSESVLENDPVYSMEARMFLNLPQSGANRRNFESGDRRSDLELLKVDSNTPAIANYQEFYENVQSVINQNQDPADIGKKKNSRIRGKYRNKLVQNKDNEDMYNRHFPLNSYNSNQFKSNYDTEKVNSNHHNHQQHDMSGYNLQRNVASKEKTVARTNFNTRLSSVMEKKSKSEVVQKLHTDNNDNEWKNKNPLTNVDDDYSLEFKHGSQRSTISPQDISANPSDLSNSPSNIYVQDGGYDNTGTSRHYERSEDSQGSSDESLDYVDVTEKPRRVHKSRRRPQTAELSRKLPKEHRYTQENDDRKRQNLARAKQRHRQRNKQNHWDDEGRYQYQDESHEEKLDNSEADNTNQNTNSWNQVGSSNVEVAQSNGYQVNQIEKPKLLVPVNVNLVPFTQFDHQNALGTSQGFDINNAMIQNLGSGMSIVSTASPFVSTSQTLIPKTIQNSRQVPDIIVGQSSMQNPVSVLLPQGQSPTARSASSTTPRSIFASASTIAPTYQLNHLPTNHILLPQPSLQTVSNIIQENSDIQIQPHGIHGQNLVPLQNIPIVSSTTPMSQKFSTEGQYLATASLAVGNDHHNSNQKTIFQLPAILHTGVINLNNQNQQKSQDSFVVARPRDNAQIQKATNDAFLSSMKDLQMQIQRNQLSNNYQGVDSIGSSSNNINTFAGIPVSIIRTQLPVMGSKNVEIINPNIKPSPVDLTIFNPVTPVNQFTAMYTTPVPVISTSSFINSRPAPTENVHLSNYVDSLTEYGAKTPPSSVFNFLPIEDNIKSASSHKNSRGSTKANLKSEIAKYAEEMVRESFKTMYNSQKLNNDRRLPGNISIVDSSELAKLRNELLRLKPTSTDSKSSKDVLEAHQTENKFRTSNSRPSKTNSQKPAFSLEQIEHILKDDMNSDYYGKQEFDDGFNFRINDYLTPPKPNSFLSKSPFHDKPVKKRPPGPRPTGYSRSRHRKPGGYKPHGLETAASNNFEFGFDAPRFRNRPHFEHDYHEFRPGRHGHSKYRQKNRAFNNNYSTFSSSGLDNEKKSLNKDLYEINNPKFHNLLGLLMKNKRLPNGIPQNHLNNRDNDNFVKILEVEKQRLENQFYNDALQGLQKKLDESKLGQQNISQMNPKF